MYARDHALIATPIGLIRVEGDEQTVLSLSIGAEGPPAEGTSGPVRNAVDQLAGYFAGTRTAFDLPLPVLRSSRGTVLRDALVAVRYGGALSYGELARQLGSSARAIGQLCARNPLPIIVPCHRVLGAGGILGHYCAGDGPITKQWLLEHERRHLAGA
ncbi:methylated-DNA--[protein]-cysteine S-methyltransferase [Sphingomonas turrisvirgatae]|uniref:Methylated-DNA--protein-cysteine methyltransferase n=1 Tax=Sphingomonas turrisvirgatae TaxID=1888892 RepID=A0A1E3LQC7_9SPHN|nr:methylated-DNA--[protein]-cysteine S-methyltransferase [Sphingomonas turrisvirgatae]ODP35968.1 cysteine methyltransferase [Sphingomonas turrisvirgatae]